MSEHNFRKELFSDTGLKEERYRQIAENGVLNDRRFFIPDHGPTHERFSELRSFFAQYAKEHETAVGLGVFGSRVRGYAAENSDLDLVYFYDTTLENQNKEKPDSASTQIFGFRDAASTNFQDNIKLSVIPVKISKQLIAEYCQNFGADEKTGIGLLEASELPNHTLAFMAEEAILKARKLPPMPSVMFMASMGEKLNEYRAYFLDQLEQMGQYGEDIWQDTIFQLAVLENDTPSHEIPEDMEERLEKLYPQTITAARIMYRLPKKDTAEV